MKRTDLPVPVYVIAVLTIASVVFIFILFILPRFGTEAPTSILNDAVPVRFIEVNNNDIPEKTPSPNRDSSEMYDPKVGGEFNAPRGQFISYDGQELVVRDSQNNRIRSFYTTPDDTVFSCIEDGIYPRGEVASLYTSYINVAGLALNRQAQVFQNEKPVDSQDLDKYFSSEPLVFYLSKDMDGLVEGNVGFKLVFLGCIVE